MCRTANLYVLVKNTVQAPGHSGAIQTGYPGAVWIPGYPGAVRARPGETAALMRKSLVMVRT
eukprot:1178093-Prorocentrum_minimum.AAC.4